MSPDAAAGARASDPRAGRSLKRRLVLQISGFVAATMVLATALVAVLIDSTLSRQMHSTVLDVGRSVQALLEQRIAYLVENTERLADNQLVVNGLVDAQGRNTYLPKLSENFAEGRDVAAFALVDFDGRPVYQTHAGGKDYNASPELRSALALGRRALFVRPGGDRLVVAAPIVFYNTVQGAVVVEFDLGAVSRRNRLEHPQAYFRLFDATRELVAVNHAADERYISQQFAADERAPLMAVLGLRLEIGIPEAVHRSAVWEVVQRFLLLGAVLTLAAVFISAWIGNSIARPILTLYRRVTGNEPAAALGAPLGTGDELEALARGFAERTAELNAIQGDLERRVRERTAELTATSAQLAEASRAKSDFLATMSHEIRTPLNVIIGMVHMALGTELSERQRNYLVKVHRSAGALLGLINDILDFSKIEARKLALEQVEFDLQDVLADFANVVGMKAEEKGLELLLDLPHDLPHRHVGDPLRLGQVLSNLGYNAVKFTERGEVVVRVRIAGGEVAARVAAGLPEGATVLHFSVRDTGIGIGREQQARLFQHFSQADSSTTRRYGGTGLGLAISKNLVEMMGGEIWVESEQGRGSTFHFTLPLQRGAAAAVAMALPDAGLQGMPVLVVDDNDSAREILSGMLGAFKFHVATAAAGPQALAELHAASARGAPYGMVLMDWMMPDMDGLECVRRIGAEMPPAQLPRIIMVTARDPGDVPADAGVDEVLAKPVTPSALLDSILRVLGYKVPVRARRAMREEENRAIIERLRGAHVLLVEDNELNQELSIDLLTDAGISARIANNGREALDWLARESFDGVLMDLQMPVMDGYAATRAIRRDPRWRDLPVIAMTADVMAGDRDKAIAAGVNDQIDKPLDVGRMFATMARWISPRVRAAAAEAGRALPVAGAADPATLPPRLPGIDLPAGMATANGSERTYAKLLRLFHQGQRDFVAQFRVAHATGDHEAATRLAHTLKGVAASIGAQALAQAAAALEQACRRDESAAVIERRVGALAARLDPVIAGLAVWLQAAPPIAAASGAIDRGRLAAGLARLHHLLATSNTDAVDVMDDLRAQLGGEDTRLDRLEQCVGRFDFDGALGLLAELGAALRATDEADARTAPIAETNDEQH